MENIIKMIQEVHSNLLPGYLGMQVIKATQEEVIGTLEIKKIFAQLVRSHMEALLWLLRIPWAPSAHF